MRKMRLLPTSLFPLLVSVEAEADSPVTEDMIALGEDVRNVDLIAGRARREQLAQDRRLDRFIVGLALFVVLSVGLLDNPVDALDVFGANLAELLIPENTTPRLPLGRAAANVIVDVVKHETNTVGGSRCHLVAFDGAHGLESLMERALAPDNTCFILLVG